MIDEKAIKAADEVLGKFRAAFAIEMLECYGEEYLAHNKKERTKNKIKLIGEGINLLEAYMDNY